MALKFLIKDLRKETVVERRNAYYYFKDRPYFFAYTLQKVLMENGIPSFITLILDKRSNLQMVTLACEGFYLDIRGESIENNEVVKNVINAEDLLLGMYEIRVLQDYQTGINTLKQYNLLPTKVEYEHLYQYITTKFLPKFLADRNSLTRRLAKVKI